MSSVSVIVPVYRLGAMATECLVSLRAQQTSFSTEILVVDDASPDDSWARIQAAAGDDPRFRVWRNASNRGLAYNQQFMLEQCLGDYIAYVDGDDIALPGKLQALADYLDHHPDCAIAYHEAEVFDHDSGKALYLYSRDHYNAAYVPAVATLDHLVRYGCFLNASSVMFRRHPKAVESVDTRCRILLDYPMHILNVGFLGGTIDRIDGLYGRYRLHQNSACGQNAQSPERRIRVVDDQLQAVENARQFGVAESVLALGRAHHRFAAALFFLKQGKDELFQQFIAAASSEGAFFDARQQLAFAQRAQPDAVRAALFGGKAA